MVFQLYLLRNGKRGWGGLVLHKTFVFPELHAGILKDTIHFFLVTYLSTGGGLVLYSFAENIKGGGASPGQC